MNLSKIINFVGIGGAMVLGCGQIYNETARYSLDTLGPLVRKYAGEIPAGLIEFGIPMAYLGGAVILTVEAVRGANLLSERRRINRSNKPK